jgi:hypothetical protein
MSRQAMSRQTRCIGLLWLVAVAVIAFGWVSLVRAGQLLQVPGGQEVFVTFAVLAAPGLATVMNRRHRGDWTGVLLGVTVLLVALAACRLTSLDRFAEVAGPTALVVALFPAVVVARYPSLQAPPRRVQAIAAVALVAGVLGAVVAAVALIDGAVPTAWWVSANRARASVGANGLLGAYTVVVGIGAVLTAALVVGQYRAGPHHARATLRPLVYPALGWTISAIATAVWTFAAGLGAPRTETSNNAGVAFALVPAVLVGALAAGMAWLDLVVRQPDRTSGIARAVPPVVQVYLARALADPSIRVAYPAGTEKARIHEVTQWVDRDGHPVAVSGDGPDRATAIIERDGVVIGLIEHDAVTASRPDAVELVATGAGLMMETEWLTASANRDLESSRLLAGRLLSAADEPRESLRRQLIDGPFADLDAVALALADGVALADCVPRLSAVSVKVRAISHGVFPEELAAGGLAEALPMATSLGRYSSVLELTAYLVARDDPHACIVEAGGSLRIATRVDPDAQVRDRVTALGGHVQSGGAEWTIEVPIAEIVG